MSHNVFVYGTLRPGHNNNRLLTKAVHIGQAVTSPVDTFTMYLSNLGGGIPFVVRRSMAEVPFWQPSPTEITGDLYQVTDEELRSLDSLEGHPSWYCREEVDIHVRINDEVTLNTTAWIYLLPQKRLTSNIQNITGDFNNIATYSDNSEIVLK